MKPEEQLKYLKSIRKPMPRPSVIIKNKKKAKLDKILKREME